LGEAEQSVGEPTGIAVILERADIRRIKERRREM
jgi:hypothetical protein